jgi:hypothetical protein
MSHSGLHYWYDNRLDKDCDEFFPTFLMYNKGKLTGFGWDAVGKYEYTKRTEFPPLTALTVSSNQINSLISPCILSFSLVIPQTCSNMYATTIYGCWRFHNHASILQHSSVESSLLISVIFLFSKNKYRLTTINKKRHIYICEETRVTHGNNKENNNVYRGKEHR